MRLFLLFILMAQSFCSLAAWETAISGVVVSAPAQGPDGRIYSCADDRGLHCLDAQTGAEYWVFRPGRRLDGFTVVSPDGKILIKTVKDVLVCVSPGGRELWRYPLKGELLVPPATDINGTVFLLQNERILRCLNRQGDEIWDFQAPGNIRDLFALEQGVLLLGTEETILLNPDGSIKKKSDRPLQYILYRYPELYAQTTTGQWGILDPDSLEMTVEVSPLSPGSLFPEEGVLITEEGRIVSGREDWFIQAMEAGEEAFDPYYQDGGNPLRSRGLDKSIKSEERRQLYQKAGAKLFLSLFAADPAMLSEFLLPYEKADSLQALFSLDYNYDLALYDILAEAHQLSADAMKIRTDNYSRSRIYGILTRWGDLRLRDSLLLLSRMEEESFNLALIMDGLGRIGLDDDGRSMDALRRICDKNALNPELLDSAVINAARLARYNGGRRILEMMELYSSLQNRTIPGSTRDLIRREMHSF